MLCQQVSCPKCAHRFTVEVKLGVQAETTTGDVLCECGYLHPPTQPCPKCKHSRFEDIVEVFKEPVEPKFPVGKCKHCGKDVPDYTNRNPYAIVFCSYECYALD